MALTKVAIFLGLICVCVGLNSWEIPKGNLLDHVDPDLYYDWLAFKKNYNRTFGDRNEDLRRRLVWEDNRKFVNNHNRKYDRGESTFTIAENEFSDMTEDEFYKTYLTSLVVPEESKHEETLIFDENITDVGVPAAINWKLKGMVTEVRNQGSCGSCWAFSALGAMESAIIKKTGRRQDLSEQQLVDCARSNYGNYGCRGGWMANAYRYIENFGGIDRESCYRYMHRDGYCRARKGSCFGGSLSSHKKVARSEYELQKTIATVGPVAIAVDVNSRMFSYYRRGVFNNPSCSYTPNHAMLAVGYGRENGMDYWLIKNSWGARWGDQGYIKMARNRRNQCGIASYAVYPIVR